MEYPEIDRKQRDGVFSLVMLDLSGMEDLLIAVDREDESKAQEKRRHIEDRFRLLDDLGWRRRTDRDTFRLTMDEVVLRRLLRELGEQAVAVLQRDAEELRITAEQRSTDATLVLSATTAVLGGLGETERSGPAAR